MSRELDRSALLRGGKIPGEWGIWIFIFFDLLMFALILILCSVDAMDHKQQFVESEAQLHRGLGLVNLVLLLTSSWFVALAVNSAQRGGWSRAHRLIGFGILGGVGFLLVKIMEYSYVIRAGYSLITNEFFSYYFLTTGIHLFHVIIGLVVLGHLWRDSRHPDAAKSLRALENGASYWHMVDLLWIVIFPVIYLIA